MVVNFLPPNVVEKECPKVRTSCIIVSGRNQHSGELSTDVGIQEVGGSSCVTRCEQSETSTTCERVWRNGYPSCYIERNLHTNKVERPVCWAYSDCRNRKS